MVRSASVVQPLGPALQACLSRWERNPDSKRTLASLRGCAAPEAPEPNHPVSTIAATPNHSAVRPCCRNRRKGASMQVRANSAQLHPPEVAYNPLATSAGRKPRQHIGHLPPLQEPAQLAVVAVDLIGRHPAAGCARIECAFDHLPCQLRLGGKFDSLRNCCLTATLWILSPLLRKVEFAVHQGRAFGRAIAEKYADLAVLDAPRRAAVQIGRASCRERV